MIGWWWMIYWWWSTLDDWWLILMVMRVVTMRTRTTIKSSNDLQSNPLTVANGDGAFMSFPIVMLNLGDSQGVPLVVNKISMISLTCNLIIGGAYCWKVPGTSLSTVKWSQLSSKNLDSIFPKHVKDLSLSILIPPKVPFYRWVCLFRQTPSGDQWSLFFHNQQTNENPNYHPNQFHHLPSSSTIIGRKRKKTLQFATTLQI